MNLPLYRFGAEGNEFELNPNQRRLLRLQPVREPISLEPKCYLALLQLIQHSIQNRGMTVSHDDLVTFVWNLGSDVKPNPNHLRALANVVLKLRHILNGRERAKSREDPFIYTGQSAGYVFIANVREVPDLEGRIKAPGSVAEPLTKWLESPQSEREPDLPFRLFNVALTEIRATLGSSTPEAIAEGLLRFLDASGYAAVHVKAQEPKDNRKPNVEKSWKHMSAISFVMGANRETKSGNNFDREANKDETVLRRVTLQDFLIYSVPVTVADYRTFMHEGCGYSTDSYWKAGKVPHSSPFQWEIQKAFPSHPVTGVSWLEAKAYCDWAGCRLPSEAEWERAARGASADQRFPWGGREPDSGTFANYGNRVGATTPVGLYPAGAPDGVYDLLGNAWEWCADWYAEDYPWHDEYNPKGPTQGSLKVVRGGSWGSFPGSIRASCRFKGNPEIQWHDVGFRCAKDYSA